MWCLWKNWRQCSFFICILLLGLSRSVMWPLGLLLSELYKFFKSNYRPARFQIGDSVPTSRFFMAITVTFFRDALTAEIEFFTGGSRTGSGGQGLSRNQGPRPNNVAAQGKSYCSVLHEQNLKFPLLYWSVVLPYLSAKNHVIVISLYLTTTCAVKLVCLHVDLGLPHHRK